MGALILFLLIAAVIALIVVQVGGAIGALFFGRKLPWIWFALAVLVLVMKVVQVALYRETDGYRAIASLAAGFLAVGLALFLQRRFSSVVLLVAIGLRGLLSVRRDARAEPGAVALPPGAPRTFVTFLGLTLLNPMTVVYFAALILGLASTGAGPAEKAAFVAGAGLASLSWQELIAFIGSRLHRRLSPRTRAATAILGNVVVIGLAVSIAIPLLTGAR